MKVLIQVIILLLPQRLKKACSKIILLVKKDNKSWSDRQEDGTMKLFEVDRIDIIQIERGNWIDG